MNTTVRTATKRITVQPMAGGLIDLTIYSREGALIGGAMLSPDEIGVLLFGIEQAAEEAGIKLDGEKA